jgi:polysaccharide biosynthesis transport protein
MRWVDDNFPPETPGAEPHRASPPLPPQADEGGGDFDLSEYLRAIRRRWKLVALAVIGALAVAVVQFLITPEEYQASARIQIKRQSLTPFTENRAPWLDSWWNMEYYPTQYQLLQSRGLAERVVRNLRLAEDPFFHPGASSWSETGEPPSAHEDEAILGQLADRLRGGLSITPIDRTELVDIHYRSGDPRFAAQAANGFAEAFIEEGIEDRSDTVGRASTFLGSQIEALKEEIQEGEQRLETFTRDRDIVAIDPRDNVVFQRLEALNRDYIASKSARVDRQSRYEELRTAPRESVADLYAGGLVGELRREQLTLEREYETRLKRFKPDWPEMQELQAEVDKGRQHLERVIDENARKALETAYSEYQAALRQERSLDQEIETLKNDAMDQNSAAVGYTNLKIEVETRRDLLDDLMRQQSEAGVTASLQTQRESNVRVVDRALVPGAPFRPSLRRNLTLGLAMGLLLGIGGVLAVDFLDRTLKTPEQIERYLGVPLLGVIPDVSVAGAYGYRSAPAYTTPVKAGISRREAAAEAVDIELLPHQRPRMATSEAYRAVRTALLMSSADRLRLITVTSATASEGKTATSCNLAVVLSQLGKRVLLIDGDLRKPRLHKIFKLSNRQGGLVSYLTGHARFDEILQTFEGLNGLTIIPSGPIPPNPSELLSSERMTTFLQEEVLAHFDYVVIDTPPVLAVTDAILVGAQTDGVVLCLRSGQVPREDARTCYRRMRQAGVRVLGAVLNGYSPGSSKNRRYNYYESYGGESDAPAA